MNHRTLKKPPAGGSRLKLGLAAIVLVQVYAPSNAVAQSPSTASDLPQRQALCSRSISLSGLERDMDESIQAALDESFQTLTAAFPDDTKVARAYRDSLAEAMTAAKAPVLTRVKESCAAAFTVDELAGINGFYESSAGRAWLEKGRTLMRPALNQAVADVVPGVFAVTQKRFCERMGGCAAPGAGRAPARPLS